MVDRLRRLLSRLAGQEQLSGVTLENGVFQCVTASESASRTHDPVVLIPANPSTAPYYLNRSVELATRALALFKRGRIVIDTSGDAPPRGRPHPYRQHALAAIRQRMVESYMGASDWVVWMDVDIVSYPDDLFVQLISRSGGGIAAPVVVMDGALHEATNADGFGPGRFYDIAGFVENGRWARFTEPWFDQSGPVFELESVGSCYAVPSDIYRRGARHEADDASRRFIEQGDQWPADAVSRNQRGPANCYTEHYSVCQWAKRHGYPVRAFRDLVAHHARV